MPSQGSLPRLLLPPPHSASNGASVQISSTLPSRETSSRQAAVLSRILAPLSKTSSGASNGVLPARHPHVPQHQPPLHGQRSQGRLSFGVRVSSSRRTVFSYWIRSLRTRNAPVSQQDERGRGFVSTILNRRLTGRGAGGLGAAGRRHLGGWGDQHAVSEDGRTVVRSNSRGGLPLTSGWHRSAAVGFAVAPGGLRLDGGRIRPVRRHDREHGTFPAATSGSTLCQWNAAAGLWRLQCIIDDLKI